jgi:hypothetical protein
VERTGVIIGELEELGLDIGSLETIHGDMEVHLADAVSGLESEDYVGAVEALTQLVEDLENLKEAYINLVFPDGFPDEMKDAMDKIGEKFGEIAERLEESLEGM